MEAIRAVVTGRVQGVGFRYSTQAMGQQLGLAGWVRNQPDGSVAVLAQGPAEAVARFLTYLDQGPRSARVVSVDIVTAEPDSALNSFEVQF